MDKRIDEFRKLSEERWHYLENGNSVKGNKCYDALTLIADALVSENRIYDLSILLGDSCDGVRFEVASKLLFANYPSAEGTLVELAAKRGIIAFVAKQTLKEWSKR